MKTNRILISLLAAIIFGSQSALSATLTFDSVIPGTLTDSTGLGTGFTHRLPGTGSSHPLSDPNLNLLTGSSLLTIQSTPSNINNSVNLGQLEAPGFFLSGVGTQDVSASALFRDVRVPNGSDQLLLYFGTSATNVVRAGFHQLDVYLIVENQGSGDVRPFLSAFNSFAPGDDIQLTFGRTSGLWRLSWQNLTNAAASGSSPTVSLPWLDASPDLYVGVIASNAGSGTSFTAKVDGMTVVPEPTSTLLLLSGAVVFLRRRSLRTCEQSANLSFQP